MRRSKYYAAITAPIAFAYGNSPSTACIVASQSLLEQLEVDEIATIYASQLAHIYYWDMAVMSLVLLVTIPIIKLYQEISAWEDLMSLSLVVSCMHYSLH